MKLKEFCVLNEGGNVVIVLLEGEVGESSQEDGGQVYEFRGGRVSGSDEDQGAAWRVAPKYLRFLVKSQ